MTDSVNATLASQTIVLTGVPASAEYGASFTIGATGGASGNPVVLTSAGACSNVGTTYTMNSGVGTCSVIADQAGNGNYAAATEVNDAVSATLANGSVSLISNPNHSTYATSVTSHCSWCRPGMRRSPCRSRPEAAWSS